MFSVVDTRFIIEYAPLSHHYLTAEDCAKLPLRTSNGLIPPLLLPSTAQEAALRDLRARAVQLEALVDRKSRDLQVGAGPDPALVLKRAERAHAPSSSPQVPFKKKTAPPPHRRAAANAVDAPLAGGAGLWAEGADHTR